MNDRGVRGWHSEACFLWLYVLIGLNQANAAKHPKSTAHKQGKKCFASDGVDLRAAVDIYLAGGEELHSVKEQYGEHLADWCVDYVHDFSFLFHEQNNFDEDISSWNVSSATNMEGMFQGAESFHHDLCNWGPRINAVDHGQILVNNMFQGSGCTYTNSPQIDENNNLVGPFCLPCGGDDASAVGDAAELDKEAGTAMEEAEEFAELSAVSRPIISTTNQLNEDNLSKSEMKPSVHTHESAAPGAQLVLLMLVVFSLNGFLLSVSCNRGTRTAQAGPYSRLALSNPTDESELDLCESETELSEVSNNSCSCHVDEV
ncbi:hypothetical protein ACA910_000961 [Epithemia clementina (nom. ined.)]